MISAFKAIFFDAGGTLFHPYPSVGEIYAEIGKRYGCRAEPAELEAVFREFWLRRDGLADLVSHSSEKIEREWWRSLVHEVFSNTGVVEDFETFFTELYDVFAQPESWRLYPGVPDILETLRRQGKRLAIISNWDSRLFKLCERLGLEKYFDFVLASAVFGASKPGPRIFQEALQRTGVKPHEAVHVGDSLEDDVQGALGVGMNAILVDHHSERRRARGPEFQHVKIIHDISELLS